MKTICELAITAYHDEQKALEGARKQWVLNTFGASLEELAKEGIIARVVGDPRPPGGTAGLMAEIGGHEYGPLASLAELGGYLTDTD